MIDVVLYAVGWAAAAFALWQLAAGLRHDRTIGLIVATGLALRAVGGSLLFFISLFQLPFAESLQMGRGIWFFASDALGYVDYAAAGADRGMPTLWQLSPTLPSVFYIKVLGTLFFFLGSAVSVGILLNLLAYLGTCRLLIWWAAQSGAPRPAVLVVLGAIAFFPSLLLWATQPLKDTLFLFLMVAYAVAAARWLAADPARERRTVMLAVLALGALLYAIAAIRWYVAILFALTTLAAWAVRFLTSRRDRSRQAMAAVAFAVIVIVVVPIGAGPYLPDFGIALLRPTRAADLISVPVQVAEYVDAKREGSLRTEASTMISSPGRATVLSAAGPSLDGPAGPAMSRPAAAGASESMFERLFPRAVAMFLPRAVGSGLGWVEIGGGRGLWLMAETDTVFLDLVLIALAVVVVRLFRQRFRPTPAAVHVLLSTVTLAGVLCYQTANFGTQFRLRSMVIIGLLILPMMMTPRKSPHP